MGREGFPRHSFKGDYSGTGSVSELADLLNTSPSHRDVEIRVISGSVTQAIMPGTYGELQFIEDQNRINMSIIGDPSSPVESDLFISTSLPPDTCVEYVIHINCDGVPFTRRSV